MASEFVTLSLLVYTLALVGIFAFPQVRQRMTRVAVTLVVVVPWAAALFAGALTPSEDNLNVDQRCTRMYKNNDTDFAANLRLLPDGTFCKYTVPVECAEYYTTYPLCDTVSGQRRLAQNEEETYTLAMQYLYNNNEVSRCQTLEARDVEGTRDSGRHHILMRGQRCRCNEGTHVVPGFSGCGRRRWEFPFGYRNLREGELVACCYANTNFTKHFSGSDIPTCRSLLFDDQREGGGILTCS